MDIFDLENVVRILVFHGTEVDRTLRRSFAESVRHRPSDTQMKKRTH